MKKKISKLRIDGLGNLDQRNEELSNGNVDCSIIRVETSKLVCPIRNVLQSVDIVHVDLGKSKYRVICNRAEKRHKQYL